MRVRIFDRLRNRFAVGNLRLTHLNVDVMRATQNVDLDVEVQFAHALDQGFARVFVGCDMERRIFLHHLVQSDPHFLVAGLVFRRNSDRDYRVRENHRLERCRMVGIGKCVTRARIFHAEQGNDVTRLCGVEFFA